MAEYKRNFNLIDGNASFWRDEAKCFDPDIDPEIFFKNEYLPRKRAIRLCGLCAVKQQCLEAALKIPVEADLGVKGGLTSMERKALRKQNNGTKER